MKLQDLLKNIDVTKIEGENNPDVTGIFTDSRKAIASSVFIALKGVQVDGHQYINNALDLGAKVIIHEEKVDTSKEGITYVKVKDGADAAGKIAAHWYGDPSSKLKVVGVTGTNGKTTTATLLYEM